MKILNNLVLIPMLHKNRSGSMIGDWNGAS